jgi:hypothetical protein
MMRKGQGLVITGLLLAGLGAIQLAVVVANSLPVLTGQIKVVDYYQYMVEGAVQVHAVLFVILLVPSLVLVYFGRKTMGRAGASHV